MPTSAPSGTERPDRLTRSADYARIQAEGKRARSGHLLLVWMPGAGPRHRVGLTVSRKVGNAVRRNRVKRWIREAVRAVPPPRGGPWDLVFIPRSQATEAGFAVLRGDIAQLFARVAR